MEGRQLEGFLSRIATAVEKMAADPQIEVEAGPPVCPHCGEFDPQIMFSSQEATSGPMSQIVIDAVCERCNQPIFIVIESYSCHRSIHTARMEIEERARIEFFGKGGNSNE